MSSPEPFLSVLIPCYNVEDYLSTTIRSLERLIDAIDVEFLFIDDGSTDKTLELIQEFSLRDARVKYVHQDNAGVSEARNQLLPFISGRYFTLLDGDDYFDSNAVQYIRSHINDADLLIPNTILERTQAILWDNHIPAGSYTPTTLFQHSTYFPVTPMLVYRTSILKQHHLRFDTSIRCGEVYDFTLSFLQHVKKIEVITEAFYHYVLRPSSASYKPNFQADMTSLIVLEHIDGIDKKQHPWADSLSNQLAEYRMVISFTYLKYLHRKVSADEVLPTIKAVKYNPLFRKVLKTAALKLHPLLSDRLKALYIWLMPTKLGYQLLSKLS